MLLNWTLIGCLFAITIPGIFIAIPRLIRYLLPNNSKELINKISGVAILQNLFMILLASIAGSVLSVKNGLHDPIFTLQLSLSWFSHLILNSLLPSLVITLIATAVFLIIYNLIISRWLNEPTRLIIKNLRSTIGLAGAVFYSGIAEEILVRWGLMNVIIFFALLFGQPFSFLVVWIAILLSGFLFSLSQFPVYMAAGCKKTRPFMYSLILLYEVQAILFGYIFWQYGIIASIFSHMTFHACWYLYNQK